MDAKVQKDEFAKLALMDRISYGLGDFAQNLVFGTVLLVDSCYSSLLRLTVFQLRLVPQFSWLFVGSTLFGILG